MRSLDAVSQDVQRHKLQQRMYRHNQVWVVMVDGSCNMPPGCSCCHLEEGHMHEAWLVGVITEPPQEAIFDQEAVGFGYLVQWPWSVLTPYVNYIQLQTQVML